VANVLLMDADVLYHERIMPALLQAIGRSNAC